MEKTYKPKGALKAMARECLLGRYGAAVSAEVLYSLLRTAAVFACGLVVTPDSMVGGILYSLVNIILSLIFSIFHVGLACFYLNLISGRPAAMADIFSGFRSHGDKAVAVHFIRLLLTLLSCIPAIAGIVYLSLDSRYEAWAIAAIGVAVSFIVAIYVQIVFSQVNYIIPDFPDMTAMQILGRSALIMRGHRFRYIMLNLSFLPYVVLGILSMGLAFIWITPYRNATMAEFYLDIA